MNILDSIKSEFQRTPVAFICQVIGTFILTATFSLSVYGYYHPQVVSSFAEKVLGHYSVAQEKKENVPQVNRDNESFPKAEHKNPKIE